MHLLARALVVVACWLVVGLAGCQPLASTAINPVRPEQTELATPETGGDERAWLARALTCNAPDFLRMDNAALRRRLAAIDGVACAPGNADMPLRCTLQPALSLGATQVDWFSRQTGQADADVVTLTMPAAKTDLRPLLPASRGKLAEYSELAGTAVLCALNDTALDDGAITGQVSYPAEWLPPMRVCAFALASGLAHCTRTAEGQRDYRIDLPAGDYLVIAFPQAGEQAGPGGYTDCAKRLHEACDDHTLLPVMVVSGERTGAIDPVDFHAGEQVANWPREPSR